MHDCGVYIVENSTLYGQIILTGCIFVMGIEPRSHNPQLTEVLSWFAVICYVVWYVICDMWWWWWCYVVWYVIWYVVWMLFEISTTEHCKSFKVKFIFHYFLQPFSIFPTLQWFHVLPAKIPTIQALPRIVVFYTNHHSSEDSMYIWIGF